MEEKQLKLPLDPTAPDWEKLAQESKAEEEAKRILEKERRTAERKEDHRREWEEKRKDLERRISMLLRAYNLSDYELRGKLCAEFPTFYGLKTISAIRKKLRREGKVEMKERGTDPLDGRVWFARWGWKL